MISGLPGSGRSSACGPPCPLVLGGMIEPDRPGHVDVAMPGSRRPPSAWHPRAVEAGPSRRRAARDGESSPRHDRSGRAGLPRSPGPRTGLAGAAGRTSARARLTPAPCPPRPPNGTSGRRTRSAVDFRPDRPESIRTWRSALSCNWPKSLSREMVDTARGADASRA